MGWNEVGESLEHEVVRTVAIGVLVLVSLSASVGALVGFTVARKK